MMKDLSDLIPELRDWNNGQGIDAESWIGCVGSFQRMIGCSTLFWPSWKMYKNIIMPEDTPDEVADKWLEQCKGDKRSCEATINHLHIKDLHHAYCEDATHERLIFVGRLLRDIYQCKLSHDFPGRAITVSFDDSPQEDPMNYILHIYQEAPNQSVQPDAGPASAADR